MRKKLSPGFSDKSIREQEPNFIYYISLLVERLKGLEGEKLDLLSWYECCTSDITGQLVFGEGFGSLFVFLSLHIHSYFFNPMMVYEVIKS